MKCHCCTSGLPCSAIQTDCQRGNDTLQMKKKEERHDEWWRGGLSCDQVIPTHSSVLLLRLFILNACHHRVGPSGLSFFLLFTSYFPSLKNWDLESGATPHIRAHTRTKTQTAALLRHLFKVIENFICSVTETQHCRPPCKNKCSSITEIICGPFAVYVFNNTVLQ